MDELERGLEKSYYPLIFLACRRSSGDWTNEFTRRTRRNPTSSTDSIEVLGGCLMLRIGRFFVDSYGVRMRGGYLRFQAQYLRRIRVPVPQSLSQLQRNELREAFRRRDKARATHITLDLYGVSASILEAALGH